MDNEIGTRQRIALSQESRIESLRALCRDQHKALKSLERHYSRCDTCPFVFVCENKDECELIALLKRYEEVGK